ncbi:MAG TPA: histidine phosphatase family protein [Ktedonobacteraceae bacterium]|nr:histidine phosphatase family protein [Ktedonobacteraceae bacterium]
MTHLYMIRHGDYVSLTSEPFDGGLSPKGIQQVGLLRDRLLREGLKADVLMASTLPRAMHTAEILASALQLTPLFEAGFEEWHNQDGSLTPDEFLRIWLELSHEQLPFHRFTPTSETWLEFKLRSLSALRLLLEEHQGKTIVLVCHGGIIETAFTYFLETSGFGFPKALVEARHTAITHWEQRDYPGFPGLWALRCFNDDRHLESLTAAV